MDRREHQSGLQEGLGRREGWVWGIERKQVLVSEQVRLGGYRHAQDRLVRGLEGQIFLEQQEVFNI